MEEYKGLPHGTKLLQFGYSDGNAARWAGLDAKYRHLAPNEKPSIDWRRKTGKAVADMLGFPCEILILNEYSNRADYCACSP